MISMWFRKRKREAPVNAESLETRDARAYVLLEEARLRCERLRAGAATAGSRKAFDCLHQELGLAGFSASSNLRAQVRHALLADAHKRCGKRVMAAVDDLDALALVVVDAKRAVGRGLVTPGLSDHMQLAQVHLLHGQELLEELTRGSFQRSASVHSR